MKITIQDISTHILVTLMSDGPRLAKVKRNDADMIIKLYQLYDGHRDALLWFLHCLNASSYDEYRKSYAGESRERAYFTSVCGFFELSGALLKRGMIDRELFFDLFNPSPYWKRAKRIVQGMRKDRPHMYENFEVLSNMRDEWVRKRDTR